MASDRAAFRAAFPEFAQTPDALVDVKLAEATATHRPLVWSDPVIRDLGILYKTAGLLALSPGAKCLRMSDTDSPDSIYQKRWAELRNTAVAAAPRVL